MTIERRSPTDMSDSNDVRFIPINPSNHLYGRMLPRMPSPKEVEATLRKMLGDDVLLHKKENKK